VGQPGRRRYGLHALREGLQYQRLAEGQAGVGAWITADPDDSRLNPDVNSYWMCDIGRFDYQWVEGTGVCAARCCAAAHSSNLRRGTTSRDDARPHTTGRLGRPGSVRFLASAHASMEELFVLRQVVEGLLGSDGLKVVTMSWSRSDKPQPATAKFRIPATDAPNVNGAKALGYEVGAVTMACPT
jgi:hypothetical protein